MISSASEALKGIIPVLGVSFSILEKKGQRNNVPYHSVKISPENGVEYTIEVYGDEVDALEKDVQKLKSMSRAEGATPKIFVGGNGRPDEYPVSGGCTNQRKWIGLPNHVINDISNRRRGF